MLWPVFVTFKNSVKDRHPVNKQNKALQSDEVYFLRKGPRSKVDMGKAVTNLSPGMNIALNGGNTI